MQDSGILERIADSARASRSELGLLALLGVAVVGAGLVVVLRTSDPPAPPITKEVAAPEASAVPQPKRVLVHVTGEVRHPGVYELPEGSRINDAVSAAGGPLEGADGNLLNLAAPVSDGQKITLTKPGEPPPPDEAGASSLGQTPGQGVKVNLNTANQAQLEELPSVGPVLAQRILAYRQTKGKFTSVRQLMEVSGVGPKKFEALKELVTI
jgi:competence protein ComEA